MTALALNRIFKERRYWSAMSGEFDKRNKEYRDLVTAVAEGAYLFVGAGSSMRVGYPNWKDTLGTLIAKCRQCSPSSAQDQRLTNSFVDSRTQADAAREILGAAEFRETLLGLFGPRQAQHDAMHEDLVRIPFTHILTTNYDLVLESAFLAAWSIAADSLDADDHDRLARLRIATSHSGGLPCIVHLHGSIRRPDGIVLTESDYQKRYQELKPVREWLKDVFLLKRVVFVGYSMADEDVTAVLREVKGELKLPDSRHFVITSRPLNEREEASAINWRHRWSADAVYYDNAAGGDHSGLATVVRSLREDVAEKQRGRRFIPLEKSVAILETTLQERAELKESLLLQFRGSAVTLEATGAATGVAGSSGLDKEIDRIFEFIRRGLPDEAISEYERLTAEGAGKLTPKQRYRISANKGHAYYEKGCIDEAAKLYLEAAGCYLESRDAKGIEILGHLLLGDKRRSLVLAKSLCNEHPDFARAYSLWVRSQSDETPFEQIEDFVPEDLRVDAEVSLSLSGAARHRSDFVAEEVCPDGRFRRVGLGRRACRPWARIGGLGVVQG